MRALLVVLFLLLVPVAPAETERGGTYGVDAGYVDVGLWDLWYYDKTEGTSLATLSLTWGTSPFPGADYDLLLYPPGSLDDGVLDEAPIATSETRSLTQRIETIHLVLPEAKYVVAVVAHQAQGETYTLAADPGWLTDTYPPAPGVRGDCPLVPCPLP